MSVCMYEGVRVSWICWRRSEWLAGSGLCVLVRVVVVGLSGSSLGVGIWPIGGGGADSSRGWLVVVGWGGWVLLVSSTVVVGGGCCCCWGAWLLAVLLSCRGLGEKRVSWTHSAIGLDVVAEAACCWSGAARSCRSRGGCGGASGGVVACRFCTGG